MPRAFPATETPLQEKRRLNTIRSHHRASSARWPYILYPWDNRKRSYYTQWDGRFNFRRKTFI